MLLHHLVMVPHTHCQLINALRAILCSCELSFVVHALDARSRALKVRNLNLVCHGKMHTAAVCYKL
jgi:hypothetical protein